MICRRFHPSTDRDGFALVEVLVVVAMIALLAAILLPSLRHARSAARLSACQANQHSLVLGVHAYAVSERGRIPAGPGAPFPLFPAYPWTDFATGWIWIAPLRQYSAHGLLFRRGLADLKVVFCPDDLDPEIPAQAAHIGTAEDAYGTYSYRHLDQTTRDRIENLGINEAGRRARALFWDTISHGPMPVLQRSTHDNRRVNVAYLDGHVQRVANRGEAFSYRPEDFANMPFSFARRLDQVLVTADHAEFSNPLTAPHLP